MKTKKLKRLKEVVSDFENSSGAASIDYKEDTMKEQLESLSEHDIDDLIDFFHKLSLFYQCNYNG